jgi:signal transduction histidine kinase
LQVDEDVPLVHADETRLRQCALNLLSNAAKFTSDGVIAVHARRCKIGSADGVAISVRDTGHGINAEDLQQLFRPFVQADNSATRAHGGAGLGLVITRRLARAMGGDVVAASELGKGSVFTLFVPVATSAAQAA